MRPEIPYTFFSRILAFFADLGRPHPIGYGILGAASVILLGVASWVGCDVVISFPAFIGVIAVGSVVMGLIVYLSESWRIELARKKAQESTD